MVALVNIVTMKTNRSCFAAASPLNDGGDVFSVLLRDELTLRPK
jgi:hypothetical protein